MLQLKYLRAAVNWEFLEIFTVPGFGRYFPRTACSNFKAESWCVRPPISCLQHPEATQVAQTALSLSAISALLEYLATSEFTPRSFRSLLSLGRYAEEVIIWIGFFMCHSDVNSEPGTTFHVGNIHRLTFLMMEEPTRVDKSILFCVYLKVSNRKSTFTFNFCLCYGYKYYY